MFVLAVGWPMVTASALVGSPALQFVEVPHLLSPPLPVHVSVVSAGGAFRVPRRAAVMLATGRSLTSDCCESLPFDPEAACAEARPLKQGRAARKQRTIIHELIMHEDAERMGNSKR